jgi:PAS domain-containing protein
MCATFILRRLRIFRRHGEPVLIPPVPIRTSVPVAPLPAQPSGHAAMSPGRTCEPPEMPRGRSTDEQLARRLLALPIGVVVVDRRYDIATINRAARCLLGIHSPNIGEDVIHLAQGVPSAPLRAAIDAAFRRGSSARAQDAVTVSMALGEQRSLHIASYPDRLAREEGPVEAVLIVVADVTEAVHAQRELEQAYRRQSEETEPSTAGGNSSRSLSSATSHRSS